jgi:hypothetical protein
MTVVNVIGVDANHTYINSIVCLDVRLFGLGYSASGSLKKRRGVTWLLN